MAVWRLPRAARRACPGAGLMPAPARAAAPGPGLHAGAFILPSSRQHCGCRPAWLPGRREEIMRTTARARSAAVAAALAVAIGGGGFAAGAAVAGPQPP